MQIQELRCLDSLKQHLATLYRCNIGAISGKVAVVYDEESTLSRLLTEWYRQALPPETQWYHFGSPERIADHSIGSIELKQALLELPPDSLVILIQSTNFRITDFRIRLELFQHNIHCVEHNHLGYIADEQVPNYVDALTYHTPEYVEATDLLNRLSGSASKTEIHSGTGEVLTFGKLEVFRGNTGSYPSGSIKGGTFPIGEAFSEACDLSDVQGEIRIFWYPDDRFQVVFCEPFTARIESGILLDDPEHPEDFRILMQRIRDAEGGIALVRELGIGYNPHVGRHAILGDVNAYERQLGVHLSIGKKHGIFGKKLPKTDIQKYHIDIFLEVRSLHLDEAVVAFDSKKILVQTS